MRLAGMEEAVIDESLGQEQFEIFTGPFLGRQRLQKHQYLLKIHL